MLISNYQYNNIARQCERYDLTPLNAGVEVDYYIAVSRHDTELYSILTRTTNLVSTASTNAALTQYAADDARTSLADFVRDHLAFVIAACLVVVAMLVLIVVQRRMIVAQRRAEESEHQVEDLSQRVYVDALTHVRNKGACDEYLQGLQNALSRGEPLEFAIGVFDCNDLKFTNDRYGHDKGDVYLTVASRLICRVFQHSPVFRIGGDEFCEVLMNEDYQCRDELAHRFEKEQVAASGSSENAWEHPSIAVYDPQTDSSVGDTMRRADKLMYDDKHARKGL